MFRFKSVRQQGISEVARVLQTFDQKDDTPRPIVAHTQGDSSCNPSTGDRRDRMPPDPRACRFAYSGIGG